MKKQRFVGTSLIACLLTFLLIAPTCSAYWWTPGPKPENGPDWTPPPEWQQDASCMGRLVNDQVQSWRLSFDTGNWDLIYTGDHQGESLVFTIQYEISAAINLYVEPFLRQNHITFEATLYWWNFYHHGPPHRYDDWFILDNFFDEYYAVESGDDFGIWQWIHLSPEWTPTNGDMFMIVITMECEWQDAWGDWYQLGHISGSGIYVTIPFWDPT